MPRSTSVRRRFFAALVLVPALTPAAAFANQFWVGSGKDCTHSNLQAAIDAAQTSASQEDAIFLVGAGPFTGPFSIVGGGITIVGGVDVCGSVTPKRYATLQAPAGQRPLTILLGERGFVVLRKLVITTRSGIARGDGGGIWFAGGSNASELELMDSRVVSNGSQSDGGGVFVSGGTLLLTAGAVVGANTAVRGGGIAAINDASVLIDGSQVTSNTAWLDGGGVYQEGNGSLRIGDVGGSGKPSDVAGNLAHGDGGGLYLGRWGSARLGAATRASFTNNQAQRGGGMYLEDAGAWVWQVEIAHNRANETGGGVHLAGAATLGGGGQPLPAGHPLVAGNRAPAGAALYADELSHVGLGSGTFRSHDTDGSLVAATGGAVIQGVGLALSGNRAAELFALDSGAGLTLQQISVAANDLGHLIGWDGTGPGVLVENSAFAEVEPLFGSVAAPQVAPQLNCLVTGAVSLLAGLPPGTGTSAIVFADPQFTAPALGDLHVASDSPVTDLCFPVAGPNVDIDGAQRTFDHPWRPNPPGRVVDAGADEVVF
jgi:hypothetical protein